MNDRQNFSVQYQPDFTNDENKEEYQFGDNKLKIL